MKIPSQTLFHRIHTQASVFNEFNPISYLFSLLNIKSKSHSQSQKSPFSLLPISSLSSLKSQVSTLNWLHSIPSTIQTLAVAAASSSPHSWLRLSVHHGLRLLMLTDQLLSLKTLRYIFFLFHLSFSLFGNMIFFPLNLYTSLWYLVFCFFGVVLICLFVKTKESIGRWKKE